MEQVLSTKNGRIFEIWKVKERVGENPKGGHCPPLPTPMIQADWPKSFCAHNVIWTTSISFLIQYSSNYIRNVFSSLSSGVALCNALQALYTNKTCDILTHVKHCPTPSAFLHLLDILLAMRCKLFPSENNAYFSSGIKDCRYGPAWRNTYK